MPKVLPDSKHSAITVPLPRDLRDRLINLAVTEDRSLAGMVRQCIQSYLDDLDPRYVQ
jgi:predicted DNA-binding protein